MGDILEFIKQYFNIYHTPIEAYIAFGIALLSGLILTILLRRRLTKVKARVKECDEEPLPIDGYPGVSVIVYSQSDGSNLRCLLGEILEQDYPGAMEVIVVNDENASITGDVVYEMQQRYPNLYMTFAPERSRNLSRKKLAVTLGMKAARYDYVVHTCGNCRIESPLWLRLMMRHFMEGKEVVIGHSMLALMPEIKDINGPIAPIKLGRMKMFDLQWDAIRLFGSSLSGRPYMGNGCNMAYRRQLFFDNKGFHKTLNFQNGDDDIFINEIVTPQNCAIELSPDARVLSLENIPGAIYKLYKKRRLFIADYLPRTPYIYMSLISWCAWIFSAAIIATAILALPQLTGIAAALLLLPIIWLPMMISWRKTGKALGMARTALLTQPILTLWHPVMTYIYKRRANRTRNENYTWNRKL